ncbi:TIM barrel protein [Candidatus Woesearchaeota archaeon]|nr:TIM barrel protein [Candidatus Woesearchaeota archaeon]MBW3016160.1 TIM barrel protein [Candidatus Woesearchaeota archaeon]
MKSLLFSNPGIPLSTLPRNTLNGVKRVRELGLDGMELEFVQNVNVNADLAPEIRKVAEELNVLLTCHGQYYVNLASLEPAKVHASINRMVSAARRLHECGGWSATWHFGFYLGRPKDKVYDLIKKGAKEVVSKLKEHGVSVWVRPETTGKATQWGDLQETIKLSQDVEQVLPCVDFSHLHARIGNNNSFEEFCGMLSQIEKGLGKVALENMHVHCSGINYGPKGERNHLNLEDSDMRWRDLLKAFKEFKVKGVVVAESPNIERDALLLKRTWSKL